MPYVAPRRLWLPCLCVPLPFVWRRQAVRESLASGFPVEFMRWDVVLSVWVCHLLRSPAQNCAASFGIIVRDGATWCVLSLAFIERDRDIAKTPAFREVP